MTAAEQRILQEFASRYPTAAVAAGGRPLKLTSARHFADLDRADADSKEAFLEAAEILAGAGILEIAWERHRRGETIRSLTLLDAGRLFERLGRVSPAQQAAEASRAALAAAGQSGNQQAKVFFTWLAGNLDAEDAERGLGPEQIHDISRLPLYNPAGWAAPLRALSVRLFADSKHIETLLTLLKPLLGRAAAAGLPLPDLSQASRSYPETLITGRCRLHLDGEHNTEGSCIDNTAGLILGLPAETVLSLTAISPVKSAPHQPNQLNPPPHPIALGIENKETFYSLARQLRQNIVQTADLLVYVGGHPNRAVQSLFRLLARSGYSLQHSGDLDPDGILILQELADACGQTVRPYRMDGRTFDHYRHQARPLGTTVLSRLSAIRPETRQLAGIDNLIQRIQETGSGVEQEIFDYYEQP